MGEHWFWWTLTAISVVWYSTVVIYVAFRGLFDIRNMLDHLGRHHRQDQPDP